MDQIIFYNLEKDNVRLSIQGGTSYENAINMCNEFIAKLTEQMAAEIARQELAAQKATQSNDAQVTNFDAEENNKALEAEVAGSDGSN